MSEGPELLIFDYEGLGDRTERLFAGMSDDEGRRRAFMVDPARVITQEILEVPAELSRAELDRANRFLYALLSNPGFMDWAAGWQREHAERLVSAEGGELVVQVPREQLFRELAEGISQHGDRELLNALVGLDVEHRAADEAGEALDPSAAPSQLDLERTTARIPPPPRPVNFHVTFNATVNYTVAAAAAAAVILVVLVAIPIVIPTIAARPEALSRQDLQRLSAAMMEELTRHAREAREAGGLDPFGDAPR